MVSDSPNGNNSRLLSYLSNNELDICVENILAIIGTGN